MAMPSDWQLFQMKVKRVRSLVVKALPVDRIHGEEFDSSGIDEIGERADHALAFEFHLVARTGRETQQRRAPVTVDDHAQFQTKPVRVPAVIFTFHRLPLGRCGKQRVCQPDGVRAIRLPAQKRFEGFRVYNL